MSREKRIVVVRREHVEEAVRKLAREGYPDVSRQLTPSGSVLLRAKKAKV